MWKFFSAPDDEDVAAQEKDIDSIISHMPDGLRVALTGIDELPGAHGPFGLTPSNPIPVNGPVGEAVYIFRLRGKSGFPFWFQRLGTMESKEFSRNLDVYEILSTDGQEWNILYFSMYHYRRSTRSPQGFRLEGWKKIGPGTGVMAKLGAFGCSSGPYEDFPYCLPHLLRTNGNLKSLGPRFSELCAQKLESLLQGIKVSPRPYDLKKLSQQLNLVNML